MDSPSAARSVFDLNVFKRAYVISLEIHKASLQFKQIEQFGGLADQMRRASKGICANLAEGMGKFDSVAERKRFVRMCLGSSSEMRVWCRYALDLGYIDMPTWERWQKEYLEITLMLQGLMKKVA